MLCNVKYILVWQCPIPQNHLTASGGHRDDAFKDRCLTTVSVWMCSIFFFKKNNNLATPRSPPIIALHVRAISPTDLRGPLRWMCCPPGIMAAECFWTGWTRRAVDVSIAPLSFLLFLLLLLLLLLLILSCFFLTPAHPSRCPQMCLFMCRARWSEREKHLEENRTKCIKSVNAGYGQRSSNLN